MRAKNLTILCDPPKTATSSAFRILAPGLKEIADNEGVIEEALLWLTARATPEARRSGALVESVGYGTRARRSTSDWNPHWLRCQEQLLSWLDTLVNAHQGTIASLAVLGAGTLRDVPIPEILMRVERLLLIDHVQLLPTRWALLPYRDRVQWLTLDADSLEARHALRGVTAIYSANIASQLDLQDPERAALLQARHVELLRSAPHWLLITDLWQQPPAPKLQQESVLLLPTQRLQTLLGPPQATWDWVLDPHHGERNTVGVWKSGCGSVCQSIGETGP